MRHQPQHIERRELVRFCVGETTQIRAAEIAEHLAICPACGDETSTIREMITAIDEPLDEDVELADVVDGVWRELRETQGRARRSGRAHRWRSAAGVSALAATVVVLLATTWDWTPDATTREFQPKAAAADTTPDSWVGIHVFTIVEGASRRVTDQVRAGAALAFTYTNIGEKPFEYLMVFAVDESGAIYWYYPAFVSPGDDPTSVQIASQADVELPEAVRHSWQGDRLAVYGLFTRKPLRVSEMEALVARLFHDGAMNLNDPPRLPVEDSGQQSIALRVRR